MELTEDQTIEDYAKQGGHWQRNSLLPYEYEFTCISFNYNAKKNENMSSLKIKEKNNFYNYIKIGQRKNFLFLHRSISII